MGLGDWLRRARFWLRRDRLTDELEEEMRLHIELRAQANRERGLTADEADRAARERLAAAAAESRAGRRLEPARRAGQRERLPAVRTEAMVARIVRSAARAGDRQIVEERIGAGHPETAGGNDARDLAP